MILKVRVIPNSKHEKIEQLNSNLKIHLTSQPQKGKANEELIKILSEHFKVKKSEIVIKSGQTSRNKIIEITNN